MKAIRIIPGQRAEDIEVENTVEALQEVVGGYLEPVNMPVNDMVILCDEEGLMKQKDYNCRIMGIDFVGTILFVGTKGEEFTDVPTTAAKVEKYWVGR